MRRVGPGRGVAVARAVEAGPIAVVDKQAASLLELCEGGGDGVVRRLRERVREAESTVAAAAEAAATAEL